MIIKTGPSESLASHSLQTESMRSPFHHFVCSALLPCLIRAILHCIRSEKLYWKPMLTEVSPRWEVVQVTTAPQLSDCAAPITIHSISSMIWLYLHNSPEIRCFMSIGSANLLWCLAVLLGPMARYWSIETQKQERGFNAWDPPLLLFSWIVRSIFCLSLSCWRSCDSCSRKEVYWICRGSRRKRIAYLLVIIRILRSPVQQIVNRSGDVVS
jgi:hypothetical protein